ncbi:MAG: hypothetical protein EOO37_00135 [Cytophagaceae bacterium]|nr:MAG: hypothetical protein EOO37_00135 [Cytophagaceae bacterium]
MLVRFIAGAKQFDKAAKQVANVLRQRERRLEYKVEAAAPAVAQPVVPPPAPVNRAKVRWVMAELAEACEPVELKLKPKKRGRPATKKGGELPLDTLELTPPLAERDLRLRKIRSSNRDTANLLLARNELNKVLFSAGNKILNCGLWGLYQSLTQDVNYKIGTALCKCRLCPNCQRVLASKRKHAFLDFFELNRKPLAPYFFYHCVFTVKHDAVSGVRTGLYTPDLLRYFAELRGTHKGLSGSQQRYRSKCWKHFVAGGTYSVEVKQGRDGSPNIHIHCLLLGNVKLFNRAEPSEFMQHVVPLWEQITGDSKNVFIEPVYYNEPVKQGDKVVMKKVYAFRGSDAQVERAVSECMKYTIKADAVSLAGYSDAFLTDLLTFTNRYYSRFGCLHPKDKASRQFQKMELLCLDYQDLEMVTRTELSRLFNPETGEIFEQEETQFIAAPQRKMLAKENPVATGQLPEVALPNGKLCTIGEEIYYSAENLSIAEARFFPYHEKQRAAIFLSRSIAGDYDASIDYAAPVVAKQQAQRSTDQGSYTAKVPAHRQRKDESSADVLPRPPKRGQNRKKST